MKKVTKYNLEGQELPLNADDSLSAAKIVISKEDEIDIENSTTVMNVKKKVKTDFPENKDYYVKKCTTGMDSSHLLNPYSIWHKGGETKAFDKRSGRDVYSYAKVNETCFNLYLRFLSTKNEAYLRNAERETQ